MNQETTAATPATENPKTKLNKLTLAQQVRLLDWLRANEMDARIQHDSKLAARATADLDFLVTPANLSSTREAAGIAKVEPVKPLTIEERIARLEAHHTMMYSLLVSIASTLVANWEQGTLLKPNNAAAPIEEAAKATAAENPADPKLPGLGC